MLWLNLRHNVPERHRAFERGLARCGYSVVDGLTSRPGERDVLVTWNVIREAWAVAGAFESRGLPVLVTENASWGTTSPAATGTRSRAAGTTLRGGSRLAVLSASMRWRRSGAVPRRRRDGDPAAARHRAAGHGDAAGLAGRALKRYGGRIRPHPGIRDCVPLERDRRMPGAW